MRSLTLFIALVVSVLVAGGAAAQNGPFQFYPLTPCRAVDTRAPNSTNGGPVFSTGTTRSFAMRGVCGVPSTAKAVSMNVTAVQSSTGGWLTIWPSGLARPTVAMISFQAGEPAIANGVIVGLSSEPQDLSVYNNFGLLHVIIDVTGYFQ
jgi:hypothetical protein